MKKRTKLEKTCPICKILFLTFSGKNEATTCSRKCANTYFLGSNSVKRLEINQKISLKLTKKPYEKICQGCKVSFLTKKKTQKFHSNSCAVKTNNNTPDAKNKFRKLIYERINSGLHKGWKSRKKLEPSYAEKYFINFFEDKKIIFEREVKIGRYHVDFLFDNKLILEVDGMQHLIPDRIKHDIERDQYLMSLGYHVFRILWKNPISINNKKFISSKIEDLLNLMNDLKIKS